MVSAAATPQTLLERGTPVWVNDPRGGAFAGIVEHVSPPTNITSSAIYRIRRDKPIVVGGIVRAVFWTLADRVTPLAVEPHDRQRFEAQR